MGKRFKVDYWGVKMFFWICSIFTRRFTMENFKRRVNELSTTQDFVHICEKHYLYANNLKYFIANDARKNKEDFPPFCEYFWIWSSINSSDLKGSCCWKFEIFTLSSSQWRIFSNFLQDFSITFCWHKKTEILSFLVHTASWSRIKFLNFRCSLVL